MIFGKKNKNNMKTCEGCGSNIEDKFSFCPHCGVSFLDPKKEEEDFGMLGRNDSESYEQNIPQSFGITDKLIGTIMNSMMKNLDRQFKSQMKDFEKEYENTEVRSFPNGIRIKIGQHNHNQNQKKKAKPQVREIGEDQIRKFSNFPRAKAKTNVKRIGDKIIYELSTLGVSSPDDVFVSKLESGYEIKAIGSKKVYVNSIPINLPIKRYSILKNKLQVEFNTNENQ